MHLFVVLFAEWDQVVAVVFVKVGDLARFIGIFLVVDMVHILDGIVAESAFGEVEVFVVFASFFLLYSFGLGVLLAHPLADRICLLDKALLEMERLGKLQSIE